MTGQHIKTPQEHDDTAFNCNQQPTDAGTTQDKSSDSNQKGGQNGHCCVDDKEERREQQPEEQCQKDENCSYNEDSTLYEYLATNDPSDAPTRTEDKSDSNQKGGQMLPDGGKPAAQKGPRPSSGSSGTGSSGTGSGGNDGEDDRKKKAPAGGCQGDGQCLSDVDDKEHEQQPDDLSDDDNDAVVVVAAAAVAAAAVAAAAAAAADDDDDDDDNEKHSLPPRTGM